MKYVIHCTTSQVGTDSWEFIEFPESYTEQDRDDYAQEVANENAAMYGIYPMHEAPPEYDEFAAEDDSYGEEYDDSISGYVVEYDPEEHDGYRVGGDTQWIEA